MIDRRADAAGESVESLEGRDRAVMAANEFVSDAIELSGRDTGPNRRAKRFYGRGENAPSFGHDLYFASRLQLDHLPSAARARLVTSLTVPIAFTCAIFVP